MALLKYALVAPREASKSISRARVVKSSARSNLTKINENQLDPENTCDTDWFVFKAQAAALFITSGVANTVMASR